MTPLAGYILELAKRACDRQLSEQQFLVDFEERILAASKVQLPNIGAAITEIRQSGDWPWPMKFANHQ
ncbi:MAG TPA: hypothetical protein VN781_02285 [Acidimicrobiales bacterium]|nr:hypothetical protein [Acidimicrobiales bacterium]